MSSVLWYTNKQSWNSLRHEIIVDNALGTVFTYLTPFRLLEVKRDFAVLSIGLMSIKINRRKIQPQKFSLTTWENIKKR